MERPLITNKRLDSLYPTKGEILICPMCNQEFKVTDETRFIRKNQYTCNWDCFMGYPVKEKRKTSKVDKTENDLGAHKKKDKKQVNKETVTVTDGLVDLF